VSDPTNTQQPGVASDLSTEPTSADIAKPSGFAAHVRSAEIDTRLLGMFAALVVIWIGFNIMSDGTFLTARNLWNLSVQTSVVAIMATGMVLVIVSRNIDLSVGSMMATIGMFMAVLQVEVLPDIFGIGHPLVWIVSILAGIAMGAVIGAFQGSIVAYMGVPSFIVTLGGLLVWRGVAWVMASGRTIAPMDLTFQLLGGGARGTIGGTWTWILGFAASTGIVLLLWSRRRQRIKFGFEPRPVWAEIGIGAVGVGLVLAATSVINSYPMPELLARKWAEETNVAWPEGGLSIPLGLATPVLLLIVVALVVNFVATRTRFGRYIYAIGGNPEAASLAGIKTKWTTVKIFMMMGILVAIAASVSIARLNAATSGLGQLTELYVIAAAVIGGTSLTGGVGTIPGAVLGALVMQSLISGMALMGLEAPYKNIIVGIVLVGAVALDSLYRRRVSS
jgi:D-xylose transport system permease protein